MLFQTRPTMGFFLKPLALDPLSITIADRLINHVQSIEIPVAEVFLVLIASRLFGRRGGPLAVGLVLAIYGLSDPGVPVLMAINLIVLLRSGLLTAVAMLCTAGLISVSPMTLDTSIWFWPRAAFVLLLVSALAAWSAWVASGAVNTRIPRSSHP